MIMTGRTSKTKRLQSGNKMTTDALLTLREAAELVGYSVRPFCAMRSSAVASGPSSAPTWRVASSVIM